MSLRVHAVGDPRNGIQFDHALMYQLKLDIWAHLSLYQSNLDELEFLSSKFQKQTYREHLTSAQHLCVVHQTVSQDKWHPLYPTVCRDGIFIYRDSK